MAKVKSTAAAADATAPPDAPITAENYLDRSKAFLNRGAQPFMIRALEGTDGSVRSHCPATEPQWVAWMLWFQSKGIPVRFAKTRGLYQVPAEYPEFFDKDWPPSDIFARIRRGLDDDHRQRMRDRLHALFVDLGRSTTPRGARRPPLGHPADQRDLRASREDAERRLDALRAEYRDNPPPRLAGAPAPREASVDADASQGDDIDW